MILHSIMLFNLVISSSIFCSERLFSFGGRLLAYQEMRIAILKKAKAEEYLKKSNNLEPVTFNTIPLDVINTGIIPYLEGYPSFIGTCKTYYNNCPIRALFINKEKPEKPDANSVIESFAQNSNLRFTKVTVNLTAGYGCQEKVAPMLKRLPIEELVLYNSQKLSPEALEFSKKGYISGNATYISGSLMETVLQHSHLTSLHIENCIVNSQGFCYFLKSNCKLVSLVLCNTDCNSYFFKKLGSKKPTLHIAIENTNT